MTRLVVRVMAVAALVGWGLTRSLLAALLLLVEPLLRVTLLPLAFGGCLVTLVFGFMAGDPRFPRWGMLALSVGALWLYGVYVALAQWVAGGRDGRG